MTLHNRLFARFVRCLGYALAELADLVLDLADWFYPDDEITTGDFKL